MNNFNISNLELVVKNIVKSLGVSSKVVLNRPKSQSHCDDFVVIKVSGNITDLSVFGLCKIAVVLFVKDVDNEKNSVKLGKMQDKLKNFPSSSDSYLFDTDFTVCSDVSDDYGYHSRMVLINTTLKSK